MRERERAFRSMNERFYVNTGGGEEIALQINRGTSVCCKLANMFFQYLYFIR